MAKTKSRHPNDHRTRGYAKYNEEVTCIAFTSSVQSNNESQRVGFEMQQIHTYVHVMIGVH